MSLVAPFCGTLGRGSGPGLDFQQAWAIQSWAQAGPGRAWTSLLMVVQAYNGLHYFGTTHHWDEIWGLSANILEPPEDS